MQTLRSPLPVWCLSIFLLAGCARGETPARAGSTLPASGVLRHGLSIIFIGDSNTESGYVTGALAKALEAKYGYHGSGWKSLVEEVGNGAEGAYNAGLRVQNEGAWKKLYMAPQDDKDAFLSPSGVALQSNDPAAVTRVEFTGRAIEVFYLSRPGAGSFAASLNGGTPQTIQTTADDDKAAPVVGRSTLVAKTSGSHTLALRPAAGQVTLLGVNALSALPGESGAARAALVHKWGRGYAETRQFLGIAPSVWNSALKLLQPDVAVLMLGTNDHNISAAMTQAYLSNIAQLTARIRAASPQTRVLLLSTIPAGGLPSVQLGESYARELPRLAPLLGAEYFDLWHWAGGSPRTVVERGLAPASDAIHWNQKGGEQVAAAIAPVIEKLAQTPPAPPAPPGEELSQTRGATTAQSLKEALPAGVLGQIPVWLSADGVVQHGQNLGVERWDNLLAADSWPPSVAEAQQPVRAWRPKFLQNAINGLPALDFDGRSSLLWLPRAVGMRAYSVVARARQPGGALFGEGRTLYRHYGSGAIQEKNFFAPEVVADFQKRNGMAYVNGRAVAPDQLEYAPGQWRILTIDPGGHANIRLIGHNQWHLRYSREHQEIDAWWDGQIAEIVFYNNVFDATRREAVEKYLSEKYGIALSP